MAASIFDLKQARALLEDPLSMVKKNTCKKHIILPPCYLGKLKTGIREILSAETKQYSDSFQGVLIAYENVQLIQPFGSFLSDQPFLHFDIQADFIVFQPFLGCTLNGVVNKIGQNHIGFLVHRCFNGMVPRSSVGPEELWLGDKLQLGQEFTFEVTNLDLTSKVLLIRGKIISIRENQNAINWNEDAVGFETTEEMKLSGLLTNQKTSTRKRFAEDELGEIIQPVKRQKSSSQDNHLNDGNYSESLFTSDSDMDKSELCNNLNVINANSNAFSNETKLMDFQGKKSKNEKKRKLEKIQDSVNKEMSSDWSSKIAISEKPDLRKKKEKKPKHEISTDSSDEDADKSKDIGRFSGVNFSSEKTDQVDFDLTKYKGKKKKLKKKNLKLDKIRTDISATGIVNCSSDESSSYETQEISVSRKQHEPMKIKAKVKHKKEKHHKKKKRDKAVKDHSRKQKKKYKDRKQRKIHSLKVKSEKKHKNVKRNISNKQHKRKHCH